MTDPRRCRPALRALPAALLAAAVLLAGPGSLSADDSGLPPYLADRGTGIPTSLFGTYTEPGELLLYAFYEYTKTSAFEYHPSELGSSGNKDFLGETVEHEVLLFLSYGISDRLAFELEGAVYAKATFDKAADDPSDLPSRIEESGLGDVEGQLRWRWQEETERRPELFSYLEVVFPFQRDKLLLGTQDWEGALGFGAIRGFRWGTVTGRLTVAWSADGSQVEIGDYAVEYLKRVSPGWRLVAAVEGESEDVSGIGEVQWFLGDRAIVKLNCGFGLTELAPDLAPEVGVLFRF